jgi:anti-sigma factor RsiW
MSCERYQKLLHLNRSGEISHQEADELRQHVRLCERCALELQRIERADKFIDRLNAYSPGPANPQKLTSEILRRVRAEALVPTPRALFDRFLDVLLIPSVRYATAAIVLSVTLTFTTQLVSMLSDVADLEARMASPLKEEAAEATYTMQSKTLAETAKSETGKPLRDNGSVTVTNDRIDVPVKDVETFLYGKSVESLPSILGSAALHIDRKTLDKIVNEIKATAELTFRTKHEGV